MPAAAVAFQHKDHPVLVACHLPAMLAAAAVVLVVLARGPLAHETGKQRLHTRSAQRATNIAHLKLAAARSPLARCFNALVARTRHSWPAQMAVDVTAYAARVRLTFVAWAEKGRVTPATFAEGVKTINLHGTLSHLQAETVVRSPLERSLPHPLLLPSRSGTVCANGVPTRSLRTNDR